MTPAEQLREHIDRLSAILQAAAPSIDSIHEHGPQDPTEEAWLIMYEDILPLMRRDAQPPLNNPDELEAPEFLASRLINAWCDSHGQQIPWAKAVEITAIITKMPEAEKQSLLSLD